MFAGWHMYDTAPVHIFTRRHLYNMVLVQHLTTANTGSLYSNVDRDLSDVGKLCFFNMMLDNMPPQLLDEDHLPLHYLRLFLHFPLIAVTHTA